MKQMSEIYGETEWKIYVIIKPPWTIITALKCAIKHWIAAINESFQRRAEYILKELLDTFTYIPGIYLCMYNLSKLHMGLQLEPTLNVSFSWWQKIATCGIYFREKQQLSTND